MNDSAEARDPAERTARGRVADRLATVLITAAGWVALASLLGIFLILFYNALAAFAEIGLAGLFGSARWIPNAYGEDSYGILSMVAGTLLVTTGAMIIAVPIGVAAAAYLAELAPIWVRETVKPTIELLAAVPSVVVGFLGLTLIGPLIAPLVGSSHGLNAATGSVLLAVMALPTIVSISEDAIRCVPQDWRDGSYALGAGPFETLWRLVLPGASSGIIAAVMLGVGRAIGETMTVLMATGNALAFPTGLDDSVRTLTATIAIEMGEVARGSLHYHALFAIGLVLFAGSFLVNLVADQVLKRQNGGRP